MIILIMIIVILIIIYTIIIIIIIIIFMKILIQSPNFTTKFHYQLSLSAIVISIMLQDYDQGPVVKVRSLVPSSACVINTPLIFPSQYIIIFCSNTFFLVMFILKDTQKNRSQMTSNKENPMIIDRLVQEIYKIMILTKNMIMKEKK